jgi:hypothetical protein
MIVSVIGIDPGATTGLAFLDYCLQPGGAYLLGKPVLLQAEGDSAVHVLEAMLRTWYGPDERVTGRFAGVERFVTGRSAGTRGPAAEVTRQLVMALAECCQVGGYRVQLRNAAVAKDWATDKRLIRAGIATADSGIHGKLRDGFDAARHGLYAAVWDAKMKDPLA